MVWPLEKLQTLCEVFTDGDWIESKHQSAEGIRLIQTGNVGIGNFKNRRDKARFISIDTFEQLKCCEIHEGDCLVSRLPDPVGRSCILPYTGEKMITAVDCSILRFNKDKIIPEYFNFFSQSSSYLIEVESLTSGATRKRISRKNLGLVEIPLPPIPEQKRIVSILDTVFADLEQTRIKTEQNLKNARELFDSYLQQVFSQKGGGWIEVELSDHIRFIDYRGKTPKKTERGLRLITAKNVRMGYLKSSPEEFVSPESYDDWMTRGIPKKGDVLFTSEAPLANVAQLDTDEKVVFAQRIITMQPDRSVINCDFLKYLLMSKPIQQRILEKGTGATVTGIKARLLKKIIIEFPSSIEKQTEYVNTLNLLTNLVKQLEIIYQKKLNAIDELKKCILQKAFSSELTKMVE
jgi:type I restriction enzyme S subunit